MIWATDFKILLSRRKLYSNSILIYLIDIGYAPF